MQKNKFIYGILFLILLLGTLGVFKFRTDLTKDKRYTLSESSISILKLIDKPILFEVYLEGDFPANFKQLRNETEFLLEEFKKINPKIDYKFVDPIATKMSQDTLMAMGMQPSILPDTKEGKVSQIVLFPYAVIKYKDYGASINLIIQQAGIDGSDQLNKSIENLEYNLISNLKHITEESKKNVGFLVSHNELKPDEFQGFLQMALENYNSGPVIPEKGESLSSADLPKLKMMDALVVAKPRKAFTEDEKVILDQYIMNGGRTLWMIDAVNAEMDTLFQSKKIMAYPIDLNLTDFFFNYGLRINSGLVKDFQKAALIRLKAGEIAGNPQFKSFLWPYFPLGIADNSNSITKNINPVKFEFPTSIDTLGRPGIQTKILFESSNRTLLKTIPNYVALSEIVNADSLGIMESISSPKIFAVSLDGHFKSAYASRMEKNAIPNFKAEIAENRMIVVADGDVARNQILKGQALPLGADLLTNQQYGNEQFLRNALDWLMDDHKLMSLRNRNLESRILDRKRIEDEKSQWQWINLLAPLVIVVILGVIFFWWRKTKFQ